MRDLTSKCSICNRTPDDRRPHIPISGKVVCEKCGMNFDLSDIPTRYINMKIENYIISEQNKEAIDRAKEWLTNGTNLYITGLCGTGKTHLACALAQEMLWQGERIKFISSLELVSDFRNSFKDEIGIDEIVGNCANKNIILDDLGVEKTSDFVVECFDLLIDKRYRNGRGQMIVTSNLNLQGIAEKMCDRIASRLCEMCDIINLTGEDFRLKKKGLKAINKGNASQNDV